MEVCVLQISMQTCIRVQISTFIVMDMPMLKLLCVNRENTLESLISYFHGGHNHLFVPSKPYLASIPFHAIKR